MNLGGDVRATGKVAASLHATEPLPASPTGVAASGARLSLRARILLWDFERGSLAYDLLCLFLVLLLLLIPAAWWGDPMVRR